MLLKQLWTSLSLSLFLLPLFSHPFSFFHSLFSLFPLGLTAAHASDHPGCKKRRVVWTEKRLIFIRSLSFSIVTLYSLFSLCLSLFCSTTRARSKETTLKHVDTWTVSKVGWWEFRIRRSTVNYRLQEWIILVTLQRLMGVLIFITEGSLSLSLSTYNTKLFLPYRR